MIFYSRELSQKLQDMGCRSESGWYYDISRPGDLANVKRHSDPIHVEILQIRKPGQIRYIFSPYDFCGPSEQCHKNAEIRWPNHDELSGIVSLGQCQCLALFYDGAWSDKHAHKMRHRVIDLPEEEQEAYMWKGLK